MNFDTYLGSIVTNLCKKVNLKLDKSCNKVKEYID